MCYTAIVSLDCVCAPVLNSLGVTGDRNNLEGYTRRVPAVIDHGVVL